jgi:hypothetical protein
MSRSDNLILIRRSFLKVFSAADFNRPSSALSGLRKKISSRSKNASISFSSGLSFIAFLLLIGFGGFSAWNDSHKPNHPLSNLERHNVNVVVNDDKKELLTWILRLVRMVSNTPNISPTQVNNDRLKRDLPRRLEKFILLWIPVIQHARRMPDRHTQSKRLFSRMFPPQQASSSAPTTPKPARSSSPTPGAPATNSNACPSQVPTPSMPR